MTAEFDVDRQDWLDGLKDTADRFTPKAPMPPPNPNPEQVLAQWWLDTAVNEINLVVQKATEYSATDLLDIGTQIARAAGRDVDVDEATEIGIAFYALGKISRIMGAITNGKRPSDDSWLDLGVYARMAQRTKAVGSWPGVELDA